MEQKIKSYFVEHWPEFRNEIKTKAKLVATEYKNKENKLIIVNTIISILMILSLIAGFVGLESDSVQNVVSSYGHLVYPLVEYLETTIDYLQELSMENTYTRRVFDDFFDLAWDLFYLSSNPVYQAKEAPYGFINDAIFIPWTGLQVSIPLLVFQIFAKYSTEITQETEKELETK